MTPQVEESIRQAARAGDVALLQQLADEHGGDIIRLDTNEATLTLLHEAAGAGKLEACRFLLSSIVDADPRAARRNNFTPLHAAAMFGHAEVCQLLIEVGADVNAQTQPQRYAPLHSAAFAGHVEAIHVLLSHGADASLKNYRNERPEDTARRTGQLGAMFVLGG